MGGVGSQSPAKAAVDGAACNGITFNTELHYGLKLRKVGFNSVPNWLLILKEEKFFTRCLIHDSVKKNILCLDCCTSICLHCLPFHRSHVLLQIRRRMYNDVLRLGDAQTLLNCSPVQFTDFKFSSEILQSISTPLCGSGTFENLSLSPPSSRRGNLGNPCTPEADWFGATRRGSSGLCSASGPNLAVPNPTPECTPRCHPLARKPPRHALLAGD
ncbi:hypothetical protein JHK85_002511 [Glycine max]|nr:hypothetical protein JHK85_002511 [Glycine max]KAG5089839.1 hypothetical protein JHK86_002451 [Glycine max]